ncbi:MAG: helix-turn-helix domain-containing protein [Erysipelotrichaceae bacterium]|nr:helix-turn-helix domain-containing protein [Erysipelotrichaceae bacterium]
MKKIDVCLVDDERNIANYYHRMIENEFNKQINSHCFYFANDLLAYAKENCIDLLICDIDMPEKNGIDIANDIRKKYPNMEIIFLTGMNNFNNAYQALQIENVSYILKIDAEDKLINVVQAKINNILQRNQSYTKMNSIEEINYNLQDELISKTLLRLLKGEKVKDINFSTSLLFILNIASGENLTNKQKENISKMIRKQLDIKVGELLEISAGKWFFLKPFPFEDSIKLQKNVEQLCQDIVKITNDCCMCVYTSFATESKDFKSTYENISLYASNIVSSSKLVHVECLTLENEKLKEIKEDNQRLTIIKQYIWDHMEKDVSLNSLAAYLHYNPSYLSRLFKAKYNCNIKDFIIETKLKKAESLLVDTNLFIKEIVIKLGFDSLSHFFRLFKKVYGVSPNEYRINAQKRHQSQNM